MYCFVIQKEQQIFEGPWFNPQLVKTLPERTLLAARIPVVAGCRAAPEGPRYCADGLLARRSLGLHPLDPVRRGGALPPTRSSA